MKKYITNIVARGSIYIGVASSLFFGMPQGVSAKYDFLPDYINDILEKIGVGESGEVTPATTEKYLTNRVKTGLTLLFVVVFIVAIIYSALAAIKFISSQGESGKLEESKGAVKAILLGFGAMLISIIGIFIILYVLGSEHGPDTTIDITPD